MAQGAHQIAPFVVRAMLADAVSAQALMAAIDQFLILDATQNLDDGGSPETFVALSEPGNA